MHKNLPFKPLMTAVALASVFTLSNSAMAQTTVRNITVDGVTQAEVKGTNLEIGTDESIILVQPTRQQGGSPVVVNNDSNLVLKGKDITLDGEWNSNGIYAFVYDGKGGTVVAGTGKTEKVRVNGQKSAINNQASSVTIDAADINLYSTRSADAIGVIEMWGDKTAGDATTRIGEHANTITITANQEEGVTAARSAAVARVLNGGSLTIGSTSTQEVNLSTNLKGASYGIYAESRLNTSKVDIHGQRINITSLGAQSAVGAFANVNSSLSIGDEKISDVSIKSVNSAASGFSYGVWVSNLPDANKPSGAMTITGNSVNIYAEGAGDVRGISVASNTLTPVERSTLMIEANTINIGALSTDDSPSIGIAAMSMGDVHLTGDTAIKADQALLARGDASIEINKDGQHSTQISGDVVFDFDGKTSGTSVNANIDVTLSGSDSYWNGNTLVAWSNLSEDSTTSDKLTVTDMKLTVKNGAQWTPTQIVATDPAASSGQRGVALNTLALDNGVVNVTGSDVNVNVEKMSGTGTVKLATDLTADEGTQAGTFTVGSAAEGSALTVKLTNADMTKDLTADDVTPEQAEGLVGNVGGNVESTIVVDEGMYNGAFDVTEDGSTISHGPNSVMQSTLELAAAAPLALNRILTNDVHKRLGDIRSMKQTSGAWVRYDGGKLSADSGLDNDFHTIQVGVDTVPAADAPRFGLAFSYTKSDADYSRGEADMDAYSLAAYGLWMGDAGQFIDVVARLGTAKTDMTVDGNKKGSMDNIVTALSGEFGWRFDLAKSFYVEPQVELAYTHVDADSLSLSEGSTYRFDNANSLMGRAGFALGLQCPENGNTAYLRVSAVHEFLGDAAVTGGNGAIYEIDGKDTWVEYGLGANFNLTDSTYIWADVERTAGSVLDTDWRATVGVRHSF